MLWFKQKVTPPQACHRVLDCLWQSVLTHGSQDLAQKCNIPGEWLTKEMLCLAYLAAVAAIEQTQSADWQTRRLDLIEGVRRGLVRDLVSQLNEIEWQIKPWLDTAQSQYSAHQTAEHMGAVFFARVAATEKNEVVTQTITQTGAATYQAALEAVTALSTKIKVI